MQEIFHSNILKNIGMNGKNKSEIKIEFERLILAPPNKPPRMIWLTTTKETSQILGKIKNNLENNLIKNGVRFKRKNSGYNGHITLARFANARIGVNIIARINADITSANQRINQRKSALVFNAISLDLMESHLKRTGSEYEILTSIKFSD